MRHVTSAPLLCYLLNLPDYSLDPVKSLCGQFKLNRPFNSVYFICRLYSKKDIGFDCGINIVDTYVYSGRWNQCSGTTRQALEEFEVFARRL